MVLFVIHGSTLPHLRTRLGDRKCEDERLPQFAFIGRTHIAASPGADMFHEILEGAESLIPIDDFVSLANDND